MSIIITRESKEAAPFLASRICFTRSIVGLVSPFWEADVENMFAA
jgi:hypothetical protein